MFNSIKCRPTLLTFTVKCRNKITFLKNEKRKTATTTTTTATTTAQAKSNMPNCSMHVSEVAKTNYQLKGVCFFELPT